MEPGKTPEGLDPRAKKDFVADFDFEFDEKHKTVAVTEQGVAKAERFMGIDHLYRAENGQLVNHLIQSLKAESLYKRDVDYAVVDDQVMIIDEFTGRILEGRRWSEGLHQAIEAKEGVRVQEENQTLATITLQNYFRLYDKLAGMTGTALTEATEFKKIYELGVVQIPTNQPMVRDDRNDQVYKTKDGKWSAVVEGDRRAPRAPASRCSSARSPSRSPSCCPTQLAAQGHRRTPCSTPSPSTPSARARSSPRPGGPARSRSRRTWRAAASTSSSAATPSTSPSWSSREARPQARRPRLRAAAGRRPARRSRSASRRTASTVLEAGGLFICGTERHESRRIDNQLRGRSGRQGDPGESRFFLSAEDDLVRLFAGDRIYRILDRLGSTDEEGNEEPIEAGMLTKQIEKAQKKVEEQNFLIRKRVLEYDDVMNEQRRVVYAYRDEVLEGKDLGEQAARGDRRRRPAARRRVRRRRLRRGLGPRRPVHRARATSSRPSPGRSADRGRRQTENLDREGLGERLERGGDRRLRPPRGAARRRADARAGALPAAADHRPALARAPLRHGLPARGHPPARVRPDRPDRRLQERGLHAVPADLMNSIWSDFARMVFHVEVEVEGRGSGGGAVR